MQSSAKTVAAYLKELPAPRRSALSRLRKLVKQIAPDATESMRYGMPYYELDAVPLFSLAAQKNYLAVYVCGIDVGKYRTKLGRASCGKGCIRLQSVEDLSLDGLREVMEVAAAKARENA